jgi:hypothetical protein
MTVTAMTVTAMTVSKPRTVGFSTPQLTHSTLEDFN